VDGASTAWVSESDFELVRLEAVAIRTVKLGLGKIVRQRRKSEFSNDRKFTVDTQASFVPPPVKP
jgi:hypothetical protein